MGWGRMWDRIKAPHVSVARILSLARVYSDAVRLHNLKKEFYYHDSESDSDPLFLKAQHYVLPA